MLIKVVLVAMMSFVFVVLLQFQTIFTLKVDDEIHIGVRATI